MSKLTRIEVNEGWEFKQSSSLNNSAASSFLPVAQFPTVSHIDLLHHNIIPDPYIDDHELECLWVNDADWTYRTLKVPSIQHLLSSNAHAVLVFDGLDTAVDVFLNDQHILASKNMHVQQRVDVTTLLKQVKGDSSLELRFKAAPAFSREEKKRIGYKGNETDVHFGGPERLFLRKAQYHWVRFVRWPPCRNMIANDMKGWDWGPAVNTCGPWKPIYFEVFERRLDKVIIHQKVSDDLKTAVISVKGVIDNYSEEQEFVVEVHNPDGSLNQKQSINAAEAKFGTTLTIQEPRLWYPHIYGGQPLYKVTVQLPGYDSTSRSIGLRRLRLLQHSLKHEEGTSFVFEINNVRIFSGGSCWIPGDFMLPRMTRERYSDWLKIAKSGNQTMIRVWGGGIVESEDFYDICDQEGILVWQDLLFACGNYPASKDFLENVRNEAEQQLTRVGHHASLALWAGNNEDYMVAERWGWDLDMDDEKGPWDQTNFPAREIYERLLPNLVEELGGDVPYWRSSPYGGSFSNDTTVGDTHIWDGKLCRHLTNTFKLTTICVQYGMARCPRTRTTRITPPASSASLGLNHAPPSGHCTAALPFRQKGILNRAYSTFTTKDRATLVDTPCTWARTSASA